MDVKTLCLGALSLGDATGYDIKQLFESAFSHFQHASYGSIYPALRQLESEGLVSCREESGERHLTRKVFQISDQGRSAFSQALAATAPSEQLRSDLLALLFFAHLLPTDELRRKLDQVERDYEAKLGYLESLTGSNCYTPGMRLTIDLGIQVYREKLAFLRQRRDSLLAEHQRLPESAPEPIS